ncbi:MAG: DUF268 domain-containing protein [Phycisphaera sp.]|nr:DUF268 domain-containing protein [Phycisphaera sp.]
MKKLMRSIHGFLATFGFDPRKTIHAVRGLPAYYRDRGRLKNQMAASAREFPLARSRPCLGDRFAKSGAARGHYFHQDLLVARRVHLNNPQRHVDVGSRVDGFVAHVASFRKIEVIDIRPLENNIANVTFKQADMMSPLPEGLQGYCDSLSCLHTIEHFGLGRYGDPVNYGGYRLGLDNLHAMLKPGGKHYFSTPIGPQRIEFNAHRIFSVAFLLDYFRDKYRVDAFSFVDDRGDLYEDVPLDNEDIQNNYGCSYGCGIFEMTRL